MRAWNLKRSARRVLSFVAPVALVYGCIAAIVAIYGLSQGTYSLIASLRPANILLDLLVITTVLAGVVVVRSAGLFKAAYLAAGILVGWLLALRLSGPLAGIVMPHVPAQPLVTMILYLALIVGGAVIAMRLFQRSNASRGAITLGASPVRARLGRLGLGVALGLTISAILVVSLARVSFDVTAVERSWRIALLETMSDSFVAPLYVRAARQATGPLLASRSFDMAIDGVDSHIFSYGPLCILIDEEGKALEFGESRCKNSSVNALYLYPYPLLERHSVLDILCHDPDALTYYGGRGWYSDWCANRGMFTCEVEDSSRDYRMYTNNERTCDIVRQSAMEQGWPLPIESLPLPR